jgi:hypothetical protein
VATNTAVGASALSSNSTGAFNSAFGVSALAATTTNSNTAFGYLAAAATTTGTGVVAVGRLALNSNTTGNYHTAVGEAALYSNTTGTQNTAVGDTALYSNTTGNYNTGIGMYALQANTTASNNTAVGYQAGYSNTTGDRSVAIGNGALYSNTTARYNTAIGYLAGYSSNRTADTDGVNLFVGAFAGYSATTGNYNTFVGGVNCGYYITTGSKNTILGGYNGNQGGLDIRTASNYIVLSDGDGNPLIATADNQTVALEGAVPNSGTGITFPATQSASSNANTLDDYERGTWTPGLAGSSTPGTFSLSIATGSYTKIGNMVTLYAAITVSSVSGSPTGDLQITGLPFGCAAGTSANGAIQASKLGQTAIQGVSFSTRGASSVLYVTYINGSFDAQVIQASAAGNGTIIDFCISYPQS